MYLYVKPGCSTPACVGGIHRQRDSLCIMLRYCNVRVLDEAKREIAAMSPEIMTMV